MDNYASESGVYPGFQRACYRHIPIQRKLLVGFCRQFYQQAVHVVPERSSWISNGTHLAA